MSDCRLWVLGSLPEIKATKASVTKSKVTCAWMLKESQLWAVYIFRPSPRGRPLLIPSVTADSQCSRSRGPFTSKCLKKSLSKVVHIVYLSLFFFFSKSLSLNSSLLSKPCSKGNYHCQSSSISVVSCVIGITQLLTPASILQVPWIKTNFILKL